MEASGQAGAGRGRRPGRQAGGGAGQKGGRKAGRASAVGLRTKLIGLLCGVLLAFSAVYIGYTYHVQQERAASEMLEQARTLAGEMDAVWEFVSVNQYAINHTSDGAYDFKNLHCAIAGKAVAVLFTRGSDYSIRFTNLEPRNIYNAPDGYERAALDELLADPSLEETYGYAEREGEPVFRYVRTMVYTQDCMECHGSPAGELDVTGYPKEGAQVGDVAGAVSIVVPARLYFDNMRDQMASSAALLLLLTAGVAIAIYLVLSRLVTAPLTGLNASLARLGEQQAARLAPTSLAPAACPSARPSPAGASGPATPAAPSPAGASGPATPAALSPAARPSPASLAPAACPAPTGLCASREMNELFGQFDEMYHRLSRLYGSLEQQVAERTEQLRAANAELERQQAQVEEANRRLTQENRYKSDFLAIVSHELRTPLTSVLAFADLLSESIDPAETTALSQVEEIKKNGAVLLEMVNNVLETARIQAGSERLNIELIDLNDIVGMVEASSASLAEKRGVSLSTSVGADVPLIESDWEKVRRILVNLVSNAIKFTPASGKVEVRVSYEPGGGAGGLGGGLGDQGETGPKPDGPGGPGAADAGMVRIDVADTGIGIPADKQQLVFERFAQENMSTVRRYGGSGLGLSLVKDLAAMLGGAVSLVSAPGEGSTFTVRLPESCPRPAEGADGVSTEGGA